MAIAYTRRTPRTLPEAFGDGAQLYVEPRHTAAVRRLRVLAHSAACAVAPFLGAVAVGAILYVAFVIGATRG